MIQVKMASAESTEMDFKTFHQVMDLLYTNESTASTNKPVIFKLYSLPAPPKNSYDMVFEGIYLGDASLAKRRDNLKKMGVTHVINASQGTKFNQTDTDADFYKEADIQFLGIPAMDVVTFKMYPYFRVAADFIHKARQAQGVVYVHCQMGVSRSASLVLAYLMLHWDMSLMNAVRVVHQKRGIFPNEGFIKQLCVLDKELKKEPSSG